MSLIKRLDLARRAFLAHTLAELAKRGHVDIAPSMVPAIVELEERQKLITELADGLEITQQAIGRTLRNLIALGYVELLPDTDKRSRPHKLTDSGLEVLQTVRDIEAALSPSQKKRLYRELKALEKTYPAI